MRLMYLKKHREAIGLFSGTGFITKICCWHSFHPCNRCVSQANSMTIKKFDSEASISSISSFRMDRLVEMCSDDLILVSDVLDTFCVQGRQRIESLNAAAERENVSGVVFDAVSRYLMTKYEVEKCRVFGLAALACHSIARTFCGN